MTDRLLASLTGVLLLGAAGAGVAFGEDAPSGGAPGDSIDAYVEALEGTSEASFSTEALESGGDEADSLLARYRETGVAAAESPEAQYRSGVKVAGGGIPLSIAGLRYNRVEGLNLIVELSHSFSRRGMFTPYARLGYGWSRERATWQGGAEYVPGFAPGVKLRLQHEREIHAFGSGGIPGNSAYVLFVGRDYQDYFEAEGWSAALETERGPFHLELAYRAEEDRSVKATDPFTLFGEDFRPQPRVGEGDLRTLRLDGTWRDPSLATLTGTWDVTVGGHGLGGDYDFESAAAELAWRRFLWLGDEITVRLNGGLGSGRVPFQELHHLGGVRLLRGYEVNEFATRDFASLGLDYALGTDLLGRILPYGRFVRPQFVPFLDLAAIFEDQGTAGTVTRHPDPLWRSAVGLGLEFNPLGIPGGVGRLRLDVTRRLDRSEDTMGLRAFITLER